MPLRDVAGQFINKNKTIMTGIQELFGNPSIVNLWASDPTFRSLQESPGVLTEIGNILQAGDDTKGIGLAYETYRDKVSKPVTRSQFVKTFDSLKKHLRTAAKQGQKAPRAIQEYARAMGVNVGELKSAAVVPGETGRSFIAPGAAKAAGSAGAKAGAKTGAKASAKAGAAGATVGTQATGGGGSNVYMEGKTGAKAADAAEDTSKLSKLSKGKQKLKDFTNRSSSAIDDFMKHPLSWGFAILTDAAYLYTEYAKRQNKVDEAEGMAEMEALRSPEAMAQSKFADVLMQKAGMNPQMRAQAPQPAGMPQQSKSEQVQKALRAVMGQGQGSGLTSQEQFIGAR